MITASYPQFALYLVFTSDKRTVHLFNNEEGSQNMLAKLKTGATKKIPSLEPVTYAMAEAYADTLEVDAICNHI